MTQETRMIAAQQSSISMTEAIQVAEMIAKATALPDIRNSGVALLKIMAGMELGFGPFASLTGVDIVDGKPVVGAHLKAAAIKRSDKYDYEVVELDDAGSVCDVTFYERTSHTGGESRKFCQGWKKVGNVRFTLDHANAVGLTQGSKGTKTNWKTSPADMLFARCMTKGYKRYCPDISGGVRTYDPDEFDDVQTAQAAAIASAIVQPALPSVKSAAPQPAVLINEDGEDVVTEGNAQEVPEELVKRFGTLATELGLTADQLIGRLKSSYNVDSFRKLARHQAEEVVTKMAAAREARKVVS